jgi:PKD repeat protein
MIKKMLVVLLLLSIAAPCFAQTMDTAWVRRYDGPNNGDDNAYAMAVDDSGNVYVTGRSYSSGITKYDYATVKYDASGNELWVGRYNGPDSGSDYAHALAVDDSGNVYVTGGSQSGIEGDYATIKYEPNGDTIWVRRYNGPGNDYDKACAIAVDGLGNVYVTGESPGSGSDYDYATIKYFPDGDTAWVRRYDGPVNGEDHAYAMIMDGSGNVCVTGRSVGSGTGYDCTTIKYFPNGDTAWIRRYDGPDSGNDAALAIAGDNSGNVYVTGVSWGSGTSNDYVTIKYYPNGDTAWVRRYNGPGNDIDGAEAIAVDDSSSVYVTGQSEGSGTGYDYATIKYYPNGDTAWVRRYTGLVSGYDRAYGIAVDDSGNVYVTGYSHCSTINWYSYATIGYDASGNELWVEIYEGPDDEDDLAEAIAVDDSGNVYVTGKSYSVGTTWDYATIKYSPLFPPTANFVATPLIGEKDLEVSFTDSSEGLVESWYWSFGDGFFSTDSTPSHTYKEAGFFDVKLIASNQTGPDSLIKEEYIQVLDKPLADFIASPMAGSPLLGVQFTDNSIGNATSWKWYFGDDDSSSEQNPYHEYTSMGTYDVTLIATSANGSGIITKENFIFAYPTLVGDSVKVLDAITFPNKENVVVPIIQSNTDSISAIVVPLSFDTNAVHVDSASFIGSRVEYFPLKEDSVRNSQGDMFIAVANIMAPCIPPGQGLLATLYLSTKDVIPPTQVTIDTTTFCRDDSCVFYHSLQYVDWAAEQFVPDAAAGTISILKQDSIPPSAPQNLLAFPMQSAVTLIWDSTGAEQDFRFYAVYRNTSVFTPDSLDDTLATTANPFYSDSDVSPGETYFYRVSTIDSSWNESEYSDTASAAFGDITPPVITLGPTVLSLSDTMATIYWETDEEADGYGEIYIDTNWVTTDSHMTYLLEHTATVTWLEPSTSYPFRVHSTDSLDNGPTYSDPDTFTTASDPDTTDPQIISGPEVVNLTDNSATIEWTTDEITNAVVYYGDEMPFSNFVFDTSYATDHKLTIYFLSPSTFYGYYVTSADPSGNSTAAGNFEFTTDAFPDTLPPVIVEGPIHSGITNNKAVIDWVTDEISTSIVQYGPTGLYGSERTQSNYVQGHQIVLTNLLDSTLYHYRIGSVDLEENGPTWSSNFWFWTKSEPDTVSPIVLTGPYASWVNDNEAQIDWTTDEISNSRVYYGLGGAYDNMAGNLLFVTDHSVVLTNLIPDTTYNFYVSSTDPSDNTVESAHSIGPIKPLDIGEEQFTTKASADVAPPVIISGPHVRHKTHNQAVVQWITDETGNSIVEYGEDQGYGTVITYPRAKINHTAHLSNLNPSTTYHFRVGTADMAQNGPTYSADVIVTTLPDVADIDPPVITVPPAVAYLDETRAIITWETDEPADSYMGYEMIGSLAERVVGESYSNFEHMLNMSLASSFNVRVFSTDPYGNGPTYSDYFTVTAPTSPDVEVPVVTYGPEIIYLSESSAKIMWGTDELSSSFVEYGLSEEYTDFEANPDNDSVHVVTLTNLSPSTTYHYRLKSADLFANVYLGFDSTFTTTSSSDITPPAAPTGLFASYGNQSLTLFWEENSESDLSGYNLHRGTSYPDMLPLIASNLPNTSYKDNGLVNGVVYYYQIAAVDQNSNESPASEVICSKPLPYILGDYNDDKTIDVVDVVAIINYLFKGAEGREPVEAGNVNCDQEVTIADVVYLINYQFKSGPDPCLCTIPEEPLARYRQRANAVLGLSFLVEEQYEEIEILLEAEVEEEIAGLQVDLVFDPSMLEIKEINTTERTDNLGLYYHTEAGKVKIGMVDIYGVHTVAPGEGSLLKIKFSKKKREAGISDAKIENAIVVNTMADELEIEIKPNKLIKTIPQTFSLAQNYPNPFNARTVIRYSLPKDSRVKISIYNILGQRVKVLVDEYQTTGHKTVVWDGTNQKGKGVASGVYFYKIKAGDFVQSKKMLLLK